LHLGGARKKYAIKSGIITFEVVQKVGDIESKGKDIVYFDDFGNKECRDSVAGEAIQSSYFSDGKDVYNVIYEQKTAYKIFKRETSGGTEMKFDSNGVTSRDKQSGRGNQAPK
jgi:hypothetical protein